MSGSGWGGGNPPGGNGGGGWPPGGSPPGYGPPGSQQPAPGQQPGWPPQQQGAPGYGAPQPPPPQQGYGGQQPPPQPGYGQQPPPGWQPPQQGYGAQQPPPGWTPQQGYGYGPPQGPPEYGYGPPQGPPGYGYGPPQGPPASFARFVKYIAIGAAIAGLLSSIPVLNILNCCFCLLNISGVAIGLWIYLGAHPSDSVSNVEAAGFGAAAGAGAGLIAGILGTMLRMAVHDSTEQFFQSLPPKFAEQFARQGDWGFTALPFLIVVYAAFGALGAFLAMQMFFSSRIRRGP